MRIAILNEYKDEIINEINKNYHLSMRIKIFKLSESLLKEMNKFDLIISDVIYNDINLINKIKNNISHNTYVIFMTNHKEMMKHCFGMNIISFLSPQELENLSDILNTLDKRIGKEMVIKNQDSVKILPLNRIVYIEYNLRDLYFYMDDNSVDKKINVNLKSILEDLNSHFMMINRKQIVNLLFVQQVEDEKIVMRNNVILRVSTRRKKELYERFVLMKGR